eukprot:TRINITY_DN7609_c0_g1_i11.p1 TRINITY_DN7609_c0_g1~~TRINITY_DN7609_c0_g1_i11.p1  ORF type:complete len:152 (-),score=33.89 TRINITY_DN7609_c0_g1_i11:21-476(-)
MRSKSPFCGTAIPPLRFFSPDNLKITGHFGRLEVTIPGYRLVYTADQLHFHRPTEHTFGGKSYDVEMHIVHSLESGAPKDYVYNKAVIGVVFDATPDKHNNFFDEMQLDKECELDLEELIDRLPKKLYLSLIHICRCRRLLTCRSRWSPYH